MPGTGWNSLAGSMDEEGPQWDKRQEIIIFRGIEGRGGIPSRRPKKPCSEESILQVLTLYPSRTPKTISQHTDTLCFMLGSRLRTPSQSASPWTAGATWYLSIHPKNIVQWIYSLGQNELTHVHTHNHTLLNTYCCWVLNKTPCKMICNTYE